MEPKTVVEVLTKIGEQYEGMCKDRASLLTAFHAREDLIVAQQKTIAARDKEIAELKRQREEDLPRLAREIDGWKAKYAAAEKDRVAANDYADRVDKKFDALAAKLTSTQKQLADETARADALAQKYDAEIKAELAAKAEAETKRQIAELEAKLKALKKE